MFKPEDQRRWLGLVVAVASFACGLCFSASEHHPPGPHQLVSGFMMTGGIPSSQPGLLAFRRTVTFVNARVRPEYGTFITTQPGLYFFSFSALSDLTTHARISLRRNKEPVATAYADRSGYQAASQTALLQLDADDVVYLEVEEGCIYESSDPQRAYTSFSGHMVAPAFTSTPQFSQPPLGVNQFPPTRQEKRPQPEASWPPLALQNPAVQPSLPGAGNGGTAGIPVLRLAEDLPLPVPAAPPQDIAENVPHPPHGDVSDLDDAPANVMRFPGPDSSSVCCEG